MIKRDKPTTSTLHSCIVCLHHYCHPSICPSVHLAVVSAVDSLGYHQATRWPAYRPPQIPSSYSQLDCTHTFTHLFVVLFMTTMRLAHALGGQTELQAIAVSLALKGCINMSPCVMCWWRNCEHANSCHDHFKSRHCSFWKDITDDGFLPNSRCILLHFKFILCHMWITRCKSGVLSSTARDFMRSQQNSLPPSANTTVRKWVTRWLLDWLDIVGWWRTGTVGNRDHQRI